jgi:hypothetical protein
VARTSCPRSIHGRSAPDPGLYCAQRLLHSSIALNGRRGSPPFQGFGVVEPQLGRWRPSLVHRSPAHNSYSTLASMHTLESMHMHTIHTYSATTTRVCILASISRDVASRSSIHTSSHIQCTNTTLERVVVCMYSYVHTWCRVKYFSNVAIVLKRKTKNKKLLQC